MGTFTGPNPQPQFISRVEVHKMIANCRQPNKLRNVSIRRHALRGTSSFKNGKFTVYIYQKVQVGKDQEKAQSERDSHSKNRGGKKQTNNQARIP